MRRFAHPRNNIIAEFRREDRDGKAGHYQPAYQVEGSSGMTVRRIRIVVDDPDSHRRGVATYSRGLELAPEGPGPDSLFRRAARTISQLPHATTCHEVSSIKTGGHLR